MDITYTWQSPRQWLLNRALVATDLEQLRQLLIPAIALIDHDDIEGLFGPEMNLDGYYNPIDPEALDENQK